MSTLRTCLALGSVALLSASFTGCMTSWSGTQGARVTDDFEVYAPFDNERDWGPSYLVGPPVHHLGDQTRIEDTRPIQGAANEAAADPSAPPLTEQPPASAPLP